METTLASEIPSSILSAIPMIIKFPSQHFRVDYDEEADVLYISFQHPQKATNTVMRDDGLLLRYRDEQLVGVTVIDASTRT